jgi:hypothetical protein
MTPPAAAAAVPSVRPVGPDRARPTRPARPRPGGPTRPRPGVAQRPRRVSGPARRPARAVELAGTLANHRWLDRLIRSRIWIAVIAFALIGIVAMQLWVLKLNGGIGRAIEHESLLQGENAALSSSNAEMSAGDRVEQLAGTEEGMVIVPPGALRFLTVRGALDERIAAASLGRPVQAPTGSSASTQLSAASTTSNAATGEAPSTVSTATTTPSAATAGEASSGTAGGAASGTVREATSGTAGEAASGTTTATPTTAAASESATAGAGGVTQSSTQAEQRG